MPRCLNKLRVAKSTMRNDRTAIAREVRFSILNRGSCHMIASITRAPIMDSNQHIPIQIFIHYDKWKARCVVEVKRRSFAKHITRSISAQYQILSRDLRRIDWTMIRVIGLVAREIDDRYIQKRASHFATRESMDAKEKKKFRDIVEGWWKKYCCQFIYDTRWRDCERGTVRHRSVERPL